MSILTHRLPLVLASGTLALDPVSRVLTGPVGSVVLDPAPFLILRELLRRPGAVVTLRTLIEMAWPEPDLEPAEPERAIRRRIRLARDAMGRVGVPASRLALRFQLGYALEPEFGVTRVFSPAQAALVDQFLAAQQPSEMAA